MKPSKLAIPNGAKSDGMDGVPSGWKAPVTTSILDFPRARVGETRIDLWRGKDRHLTEVSLSTPAAVAEMPTYLSELRAEGRTARINFRAEDSTNQLLRLLMLG